MRVPVGLLVLCGGVVGYALLRSGPVASGLLLLALVSALAALLLVLHAAIRKPGRPHALQAVAKARWILVDGSNVMHWRDEVPMIGTVAEVVRDLATRGFSPGVVFDANVGHKTAGRYQDDAELARLLGLPKDRVLVVPRGTQADQYLLNSARDLNARVVTDDRFRDWAEAYPEVRVCGFLIRGGYREGALWFDEAALLAAADKPVSLA